MGDIADRSGLLAGQVAGASSVELLVDPLLRQRLAQLLVLRDGYNNRNDLAAVVDHVVGGNEHYMRQIPAFANADCDA
jgi:hypothetical protein